MGDIGKLGTKLLILAAAAGLALSSTNALTKGPIAEQSRLEADLARRAVLPAAVSFEKTAATPEGVSEAYYALDASGATIGGTAKLVTKGYGGEIEVTVGVDANGTVTGISVGGANFKETAGLGAKTKDAKFTSQFAGKAFPVALKKNGGEIDAVASATISSTAVTNAVNTACEALETVLAGR